MFVYNLLGFSLPPQPAKHLILYFYVVICYWIYKVIIYFGLGVPET